MEQQKWWGWGSYEKFTCTKNRSLFEPFLESKVGSTGDFPVPDLDTIEITKSDVDSKFFFDLCNIFEERVSTDKLTRLTHTYGKSFRDLLRVRENVIHISPDYVVFPDSEEEISSLLKLASEHKVSVIPFGGGTNIVGSVESVGDRPTCVVSLRRMNRLLEFDKASHTATVQCGALGPEVESQLGELGYTLGHYPDSFEFSTLGGWIATRSSGMQSDKYGNIEDMVLSLKMVTPAGEIKTVNVPRHSIGFSVKDLLLGSEGTLGIITQATINIRETPNTRKYYGFLFPNFHSGLRAMHSLKRGIPECSPTTMRLNDPFKTQLSVAFKEDKKPNFIKDNTESLAKYYMKKVKGFDFDEVSLMIIGFDEPHDSYSKKVKKIKKLWSKQNCFFLGDSVSETFWKTKYDFPYIRDYLLDRDIAGDVSETSTTWENIEKLYDNVIVSTEKEYKRMGLKGVVGCHCSHTYEAGASLYFTFGWRQRDEKREEDYNRVKSKVQQLFIDNKAVPSHHHSCGYEHNDWTEDALGTLGVETYASIKDTLDPDGIMNPEKILSKNKPARWKYKK